MANEDKEFKYESFAETNGKPQTQQPEPEPLWVDDTDDTSEGGYDSFVPNPRQKILLLANKYLEYLVTVIEQSEFSQVDESNDQEIPYRYLINYQHDDAHNQIKKCLKEGGQLANKFHNTLEIIDFLHKNQLGNVKGALQDLNTISKFSVHRDQGIKKLSRIVLVSCLLILSVATLGLPLYLSSKLRGTPKFWKSRGGAFVENAKSLCAGKVFNRSNASTDLLPFFKYTKRDEASQSSPECQRNASTC